MAKTENGPMVSINLCCYNSEKYLRETLDSIVNQTYKNWELVIINDGSSDSTESIINEYIKQGYRIIYHYQENSGLGPSRNEALRHSSGEYIAFIDHDDIWKPHKLEKQVSAMEKRPDTAFLYSNYFVLKGKRRFLALRKPQPEGHVFESFLYHYPVGILTAMVRRKAIGRLKDLFDKELVLSEEFDLFLRLLYDSKAAYIDEPLADYRLHSDMSSIKHMLRFPDEEEYIFKKLENLHPGFENDYSHVLKKRRKELVYLRAKILMKKGDLLSARNMIKLYRFSNFKCLFLYIFSYLPVSFWNFMSINLSRSSF